MIDVLDSEVSAIDLPKKVYCVHIKNLPSNVDGDVLAKKFGWPLSCILFNSPIDDQSSTTECSLKGMGDRQMAENFVSKWDGEKVSGRKIECDVDEDKLDLCKNFRVGQCSKADDVCDWEHIKCTTRGTCSNDCPYGHDEGVKTGFHDSKLYSLIN